MGQGGHMPVSSSASFSPEEKLGRNQALFREVNERIRGLAEHRGEALRFGIVCECSDETCSEPIEVSIAEYEQVRATPTAFFVLRGHEIPEIERVMLKTREYEVVQKFGAAAAVVDELNPRSPAS
jgi:hypothetical protein